MVSVKFLLGNNNEFARFIGAMYWSWRESRCLQWIDSSKETGHRSRSERRYTDERKCISGVVGSEDITIKIKILTIKILTKLSYWVYIFLGDFL